MAKKTVRKKTSKARAPKVSAAAPVEMSTPAAPKKMGWVPKILVAVGVIFLLWEGKELLNENIPPKAFNVKLVTKFNGSDLPCGNFSAWSVAWLGNEMAVVDQQHDRVLLFDPTGKFLKAVGHEGNKGPDAFHEPSAVIAYGKGQFSVMDTWNSAIKSFNEKGVSTADLELGPYASFYGPRGLGWDGRQYVICDTGSHRLVAVSADGKVLKTQGGHGKEKDQWDSPTGVAADAKGNIYVTDSGNHRIKVLDPSWDVQKILKLEYDPQVIALDPQGRVYFTGNNQPYIPVYDSSLKLVGALTNADTGEKITGTKGIAISPDGRLFLADGDTVQVYQITQ